MARLDSLAVPPGFLHLRKVERADLFACGKKEMT